MSDTAADTKRGLLRFRQCAAATLFLTWFLVGCASTSERLTQRGQESISLLRNLSAEARPRLVVAPVEDRTQGGSAAQFSAAMAEVGGGEGANSWLAGVHDLLLTGILNSGAFTVLERNQMSALKSEQLFAAKAGDKVDITASLEGAEFILVPALTGFKPSGGGALPLPVPISNDGDFALIWFRTGTSSISMDLRLVDVASGRVVQATAVRGKARDFAIDLDLFLLFDQGYADLPGVLGYYNRTPLHAAMLKMVGLAVDRVAAAAAPQLGPIASPKTAALFAEPKTNKRQSPASATAPLQPAPESETAKEPVSD